MAKMCDSMTAAKLDLVFDVGEWSEWGELGTNVPSYVCEIVLLHL